MLGPTFANPIDTPTAKAPEEVQRESPPPFLLQLRVNSCEQWQKTALPNCALAIIVVGT